MKKKPKHYTHVKKVGVKPSKNLIDMNFFSEGIDVDISRIFPMVVLSTMSSGKSTLINALLGKDILPSKNQACTAKIYSVLDDDTIKVPKVYITRKDGTVTTEISDISKKLDEANNDESVVDVLMSGQIKGVLNTDKALLLIDTPGINNSQDSSHKLITQSVLKKINGGLILYVINATQMGINDDLKLLILLREFLSKHKKVKPLFVVNKIDEIDFEKESIVDLMFAIKDYLEYNGIEAPEIVPVSALAAKLFKKVLAGEELTRVEYKNFLAYYDLFKTSDLRLTSYATTQDLPDQYKKIKVKDEEYAFSNLLAAIENTGITYLEKCIQQAQILSSGNSSVKINIKL